MELEDNKEIVDLMDRIILDDGDAVSAMIGHALRNAAMRPEYALDMLKFVINNYNNTDRYERPSKEFDTEIRQTLHAISVQHMEKVVDMLKTLGGYKPAKFAKEMYVELNVPEQIRLDDIYLDGKITPSKEGGQELE